MFLESREGSVFQLRIRIRGEGVPRAHHLILTAATVQGRQGDV